MRETKPRQLHITIKPSRRPTYCLLCNKLLKAGVKAVWCPGVGCRCADAVPCKRRSRYVQP